MLKSSLLIIIIFFIVMIMAITISFTGFKNNSKKKELFGSSDWVGEWRSLSQPYVIYYDPELYPQYDPNYLKLNYKPANQVMYQ